MNADPYNAVVRDHFANPEHAGEIHDGVAGYYDDQGIRLRFSARLRGNQIEAMRFAAWGCPHVIAAAEVLCRRYEGSPATELEGFQSAQIIRDLAVPAEKTGRILVVEDALRSLGQAIRDRSNHLRD